MEGWPPVPPPNEAVFLDKRFIELLLCCGTAADEGMEDVLVGAGPRFEEVAVGFRSVPRSIFIFLTELLSRTLPPPPVPATIFDGVTAWSL